MMLQILFQGIQIGMGPGGELRYPSHVPQDFTRVVGAEELGEFQCYDMVSI